MGEGLLRTRISSYMVEFAIRSARKMTHADWPPSRAISLSYRPTSFGGKISEYMLKTNKSYVLQKLYNNKLRKNKLNVPTIILSKKLDEMMQKT